MINDSENNPKYIPFHINGFISFMKYYSFVKKYTEEEIEELRVMPYVDYLETEHWKLLRMAVLERMGRQCVICGNSHVEVHVHHLSYRRKGHENINDLTCLCNECHKKVHHIAL
jgi:hypothetical protein